MSHRFISDAHMFIVYPLTRLKKVYLLIVELIDVISKKPLTDRFADSKKPGR
jgi:hypothetical protein